MEKAKNISIIVLAIGLVISIVCCLWLNSKYSQNESIYQSKADSNTEIQTKVKTKYVDRVVEKEIVKTIHDTLYVSKTDSVYNEEKTETHNEEKKEEKTVVVKDDLFNIYLDGNVKANLDLDIIPELGVGIIIKEKFYGQIGIDYDNSKINPNAKIGIRLELF